VKRKGHRREAGSEGSVEQRCEPMDKNRIQGASAGRAGDVSRSPYPSTARSVDSAVVHRTKRNDTLPKATALWLTSISKNFSTGSITTA
jgi:hypothetical protein